ncbi:MAG: phospholipase [Acidobacteria bacterium]|nr:phospholipase [Acidobacteriota bacterium]
MNQSDTFQVATQVRGRALLRRATESQAPLLVGFHGYGENAERLLEAIVEIPGVSTWHVASLQALHPFYNSKTGEVVASWMTKLDRELAIEDNIQYVARALEQVEKRLEIEGPTVFLGFSQGTAMAYRAAGSAGHACDGLIALTGDAPAEITDPSICVPSRVLIGRGTDDPWYDEAKMESDLARLQGRGIEVEVCVFEGGHEWTTEFRGAARDFLRSLRS